MAVSITRWATSHLEGFGHVDNVVLGDDGDAFRSESKPMPG